MKKEEEPRRRETDHASGNGVTAHAGLVSDPLHDVYHESVVDHPAHLRYLVSKDAALLVVDLQYLDAARGQGIFKDALRSGVSAEAQEYYFSTLEQRVLPNVQRLQAAFRHAGLEVIHLRICSLTQDGRDRSSGHKRLHIHAPPGSLEAEFLPEVAPLGDEIIINKTTSGVFPSTNLHYVLTNLGVRALYVVGVYTNECVETTVRDACDRGYFVTMVGDACTTVTEELHQASINAIKDRYARVIDTDEVVGDIEKYVRTGEAAAVRA